MAARRRSGSIGEPAIRKFNGSNLDVGKRFSENFTKKCDGPTLEVLGRLPETSHRQTDFSKTLFGLGRLVENLENKPNELALEEKTIVENFEEKESRRVLGRRSIQINDECVSVDQTFGTADLMTGPSLEIVSEEFFRSTSPCTSIQKLGDNSLINHFHGSYRDSVPLLSSLDSGSVVDFPRNESSSPIPQEFYNALQMNLQIANEEVSKPSYPHNELKNLQKEKDFEKQINNVWNQTSQNYPTSGFQTATQDFRAIQQMNQQFSQELHYLKSETQQLLFQQSLTQKQKNLNWQTLLQQSNKLLKENFQILQQQQQQQSHYNGTLKRAEEIKQMQTSLSAQDFNEKNKTLTQEDLSFMDIVRSQNEIVITQKFGSESVSGMSNEIEGMSKMGIRKTDSDLKPTAVVLVNKIDQAKPSSKTIVPDALATGEKPDKVKKEDKINHSISHQQYSSSTDEGIETDIEDSPGGGRSSGTGNFQRLSSYISAASSVTHQKSLSQHLSCDSKNSSSHISLPYANFPTFEASLDYQIDLELASSLPSCSSPDCTSKSLIENAVMSTSTVHPGMHTSGKSVIRHNPLTSNCNRNLTRSPIDFREGRRASDGLVAQQVISSHQLNYTNFVAFNSQRLNETGKSKGVMELHLVQREHEVLKNKYQTLSLEEQSVRQIQHCQYHQKLMPDSYSEASGARSNPQLSKRISLPESFSFNQCKAADATGKESLTLPQSNSSPPSPPIVLQQSSLCKTPLQQQLMQHRLLQQKRHILQKQGAFQLAGSVSDNSLKTQNSNTCTPVVSSTIISNSAIPQQLGVQKSSNMSYISSRQRQMLRQASYKLAQQTPVLPPLPTMELPSDTINDLITIAEDCSNEQAFENGSKLLEEAREDETMDRDSPNSCRRLPVLNKVLPGDRLMSVERQLPTSVNERCERQLPVPPDRQIYFSEGRQLPTPPCERARPIDRILPHQPGTGRLLPNIGIPIQKTNQYLENDSSEPQLQINFSQKLSTQTHNFVKAFSDQFRKNEKVQSQSTGQRGGQECDFIKQRTSSTETKESVGVLKERDKEGLPNNSSQMYFKREELTMKDDVGEEKNEGWENNPWGSPEEDQKWCSEKLLPTEVRLKRFIFFNFIN